MTSRRSQRNKYHSDDDDDDNRNSDDGYSTRRRRRTRARDDFEDDDYDDQAPRRRRQHRRESDEEEDEKYNTRNKKETKEKKSSKTRRYSDEDDVSEDQSRRRSSRKRDNDEYRNNSRRRRDESEDEDDEEELSRKSQRSRRRRVEYSDDDNEGRDSRRRRRGSDDDQATGRRTKEEKKRSRRNEYVESDDDDDDRSTKKQTSSSRKTEGRRERSRRGDDEEEEKERRRSGREGRSRKYYSDDEDEEKETVRRRTKKEDDEEEETSRRRNKLESDEEKKMKGKESKSKTQITIRSSRKTSNADGDDDLIKQPQIEELSKEDGSVDEGAKQEEAKESNPFAKYEREEDAVEEQLENVESVENPFQKYKLDEEEIDENQPTKRQQNDEAPPEDDKTPPEDSETPPEAGETPLKDGKYENPFEKYKENVEGDHQSQEKQQNKPTGKNVLSTSQMKVSKGNSTEKPPSVNVEEQQKDEKKKRRRDKDASASILDVINWKLGGEDKYTGSDVVPESKDVTYTSKLDSQVPTDALKETVGKGSGEIDGNESKVSEKTFAEEEFGSKKVNNPSETEEVVNHENQPDTRKTALVNGYDEHTEDVKSSENDNLNSEQEKKKVTEVDLAESLKYLNSLPDLSNLSKSSTLSNLMDTYLKNDHQGQPRSLEKPKLKTVGDVDDMAVLEENLKSIRQKNKKQPPPPTRTKPIVGTRSWEDPREQQRQKNREKQWPPKEPPKDLGAYVVESYGQTDPYSKRLIKDIQRLKREEEEKREAEKRAEVVSENAKPVSTLRSTFATKVPKPRPGMLKPVSNIATERSWIKHEKKEVVFDAPPDEPDWMKLIRNRRWKSTVRARFPCKTTDKTDFERRSTTPKNWRKLAKDKNALRMLSEIVGIGAEGEELFMRLATQRQKIEDDQEEIDKLTAEELMAYEVAREALGEDAAYSLQMDNPLPAARMRPILNSTSSGRGTSDSGELESLMNSEVSASSSYPFTTSQLEAAYLTNQLLRLHPEEFRKLMSLERSRQATLRWQFSSDPFDSVHEHQTLPLEIALLASEEPRVTQAMKKILGMAQGDDSVFATPIPDKRPRRTRSDGGYSNSYYGGSESDYDGYDSSQSVSSSSSFGGNLTRGRSFKKKGPPPPVKPRCRSVSPGMNHQRPNFYESRVSRNTLEVPKRVSKKDPQKTDDDREVQAHSLLTDEDLALSEEISKLQELTSNITRDINEELKDIEASIDDRKKGFYEDAIRRDQTENKTKASNDIDVDEIASRRKGFIEKDLQSTVDPNVRHELPKTRHKVQRINSSAQLDAIFRRRRQISESDMEDNDDDDNVQLKQQQIDGKATAEMTNLIKDINDTFGIK